MPLLDHFRPPLSDRRPWESFHATWAGSLADRLNHGGLPPGYIALEQIHAGASLEIDVSTYDERDQAGASERNGGVAVQTIWTPTTAPMILPAVFPESCTVEIVTTEGGRTLAAAIELVSPGNKDRGQKRRLFAAKCATYLARGIGLVILDVVTTRTGNLHNELIDLLGLDTAFRMPDEASLYTVGYRPLRRDQNDQIDAWPMALTVGAVLPTVPLSLSADHCVPVELEAAYLDACRRRNFDEVGE
jgi:hypothetical protein